MSHSIPFPAEFKGDIVTPQDANYPDAIKRWAINAQRKAKVVAFVNDAKDVSIALKYAKEAQLPTAIRGGGHSTSGASSAEDGLVIDLSRYLNGVTVDAEKKLAYVGGGATWEAVDKTAIQHELATVGGTVNHTGVGGLLLGGGYGWLSPSHGLAIDNLVQATVVLADGSIVTANAEENKDLFWAIRGGGCNFGVCTEFVMQLHPQRRNVFGGTAVFLPHMLADVIAVTREWWKGGQGPSEKEGMLHIFTRGPGGEPCIVLLFFYNGTEAEGRENFKAFFDLKPVADMTRELPYEEMNEQQNPFATPGRGQYFKGLHQGEPEPKAVHETFDATVRLSSKEDVQVTVIFEYMSLKKINSVPNDSTAFSRTKLANILAIVSWNGDTPEGLTYARESGNEMWAILARGQVNEMAARDNTGYANYDTEADKEEARTESRLCKVFGDNYPRLQMLKKKFDPEMVFHKWFAIRPLS